MQNLYIDGGRAGKRRIPKKLNRTRRRRAQVRHGVHVANAKAVTAARFYLNEIADGVSDATLYAPFALVAPFGAFGIGLVIVLSLLTEFAGVLAAAAGTARRYDGPLGKSDRAVVFGALGLWIAIAAALPSWIRWLIPVLVIMLALTVVNRVYRALGGTGGILV